MAELTSTKVFGDLLVTGEITGDLKGIDLKADKATKVTASTGLSGGGTLASDLSLSVKYGTAAGTAAQGNDSRINNGQTAFGWGNHASAGYVKTDTTYTAGNGLTLSGTQFSLPVAVTGTGTYVQSVTQTATGISVTLGTPPNTTYSEISTAEIDAGTASTSRAISARRLKYVTDKLAPVSHSHVAADIPALDASKITTGTFAAARIPTLNQNTTGSAASLTTARTINGTAFNGTANITTSNWGTARNITIGNSTKSVNGSANVSWTLEEIGISDGGKTGYDNYLNLGTVSNTTQLDLSQASEFDVQLSVNTTVSFINTDVPTGKSFSFVVRIRQSTANRTVSWPSGITWLTPSGSAPAAPSINKTKEYILSTTNGTSWFGREGASN